MTIAICDEHGKTLEQTEGDRPLVYIHGDGELPPGVEAALEGATVGTKLDLMLEVEEAFGPHDPAEVIAIPRAELPEDLDVKPGDWLPLTLEPEEGDDGDDEEVEVIVVAVDEEAVTIDLNHPYAGQRLRFQVEVLGVEPSTD